MNKKYKIYFLIAIILYFVGDLTTTFYGLKNGEKETNIIFNIIFTEIGFTMGFTGMVIAKILFFILAYFIINKFEKFDREYEIGIIIGAIIAMGLVTILINIGFYNRILR